MVLSGILWLVGALVVLPVLYVIAFVLRKNVEMLCFRDKGNFKGPELKPLVGCLEEVNKLQEGNNALEYVKKWGRNFRLWAYTQRFVVTSDPDVVRAGLTENWERGDISFLDFIRAGYPDGVFEANPHKLWKMQRHYLNPGFPYAKLKLLHPHILSNASRLLDIFEDAAQTGKLIDIDDLFIRLTFDIIAELAAGSNVGALENPKTSELFNRFMRWGWFLQDGLVSFHVVAWSTCSSTSHHPETIFNCLRGANLFGAAEQSHFVCVLLQAIPRPGGSSGV